MSKELQNLEQDKIIQLGMYEAAKKKGDQIGMRRATKKIDKINAKIYSIIKGSK
jgi:hypothetical protein